jgi:hypothetical protein
VNLDEVRSSSEIAEAQASIPAEDMLSLQNLAYILGISPLRDVNKNSS